MSVELNDFFAAGFFLTKPVTRPDYCDSKLLPGTLVSLSSCICKFFPSSWTIDWCSETEDKRKEKAAYFGIPEDRLGATIQNITQLFDSEFGWENVIYSRNSAKKLLDTHLSADGSIWLLGAALHKSDIDSYMNKARPPEQQPGYAPVGAHGTYEMLQRRVSLDPPLQVMGFEPIVYEHSLSCSWLCNGLETECHNKLGITPNNFGLIGNYNEAKQCTDYISSDEVGAEPGLWLPWLVVRYV